MYGSEALGYICASMLVSVKKLPVVWATITAKDGKEVVTEDVWSLRHGPDSNSDEHGECSNSTSQHICSMQPHLIIIFQRC